MFNIDEVQEKTVNFIEEYINKSGAKGAIIGISGGIDSAVVAALTAKAIGPNRVLGLIMPCESNSKIGRASCRERV